MLFTRSLSEQRTEGGGVELNVGGGRSRRRDELFFVASGSQRLEFSLEYEKSTAHPYFHSREGVLAFQGRLLRARRSPRCCFVHLFPFRCFSLFSPEADSGSLSFLITRKSSTLRPYRQLTVPTLNPYPLPALRRLSPSPTSPPSNSLPHSTYVSSS